jgi:hypothetical protein
MRRRARRRFHRGSPVPRPRCVTVDGDLNESLSTSPSPAVSVAPTTAVEPTTLPRTGRPNRELLVWSGLLLALGGGAIAATTRSAASRRQNVWSQPE